MDISNYIKVTDLSITDVLSANDSFLLAQQGESKQITFADLSSRFRDAIRIEVNILTTDLSNQLMELSAKFEGHLSDYATLVSSVLALRNCGIKTNKRIDDLSGKVEDLSSKLLSESSISSYLLTSNIDVEYLTTLSTHVPSSPLVSTLYECLEERLICIDLQLTGFFKREDFNGKLALSTLALVSAALSNSLGHIARYDAGYGLSLSANPVTNVSTFSLNAELVICSLISVLTDTPTVDPLDPKSPPTIPLVKYCTRSEYEAMPTHQANVYYFVNDAE